MFRRENKTMKEQASQPVQLGRKKPEIVEIHTDPVCGMAVTENLAAAAARVADAVTAPMSDLYASGEYRAHLAVVLAERALAQAVSRAG